MISSQKDNVSSHYNSQKNISTYTSIIDCPVNNHNTQRSDQMMMRSSSTMQWFRKRYQTKTKQYYMYKPEELVKDIEIEEAFYYCPKKDENKIVFQELCQMFNSYGIFINEEDLHQFFKEVDKDRDLALNLSEFKQAVVNQRANIIFSKLMQKVRDQEWVVIQKEIDIIQEEIREKYKQDIPVDDLVDLKNKLLQKKFKIPINFGKMISYINFLRSRNTIDSQFSNRPVGLCENLEKIKRLLNLTGQLNQASLYQINCKKKKDWRSNSLLMNSVVCNQDTITEENEETMKTFRNKVDSIADVAKMNGIDQAHILYLSMSQPCIKFKKMDNFQVKDSTIDNIFINSKSNNMSSSCLGSPQKSKKGPAYMKLKNQLKNTFIYQSNHLINEVLNKQVPKELQTIDRKIKQSISQNLEAAKISYDQSIAKKQEIKKLKIELNKINQQLKAKYNIKDHQLKNFDLTTKQDKVLENTIQTIKPDFSCILSPIELENQTKIYKFNLMHKRPMKNNRMNFMQIKKQLFVKKPYNNNISSQQTTEQLENFSIPQSLLPTLSQFSFVNSKQSNSNNATSMSFKQNKGNNVNFEIAANLAQNKQHSFQNQKIFSQAQRNNDKINTQKSFYDTSNSQIQQNNTCESSNPQHSNIIQDAFQQYKQNISDKPITQQNDNNINDNI